MYVGKDSLMSCKIEIDLEILPTISFLSLAVTSNVISYSPAFTAVALTAAPSINPKDIDSPSRTLLLVTLQL
jgi:hypothetical protein